jgi:hypothetical protein
MRARFAAAAVRRVRWTEATSQAGNTHRCGAPYGRGMWSLAGTMIGLIGLIAFDDLLEQRPPRHTWLVCLTVVGAVALLMLAAIEVGRLLA